jgi:alkylresorcinol/alkylpyrone synthase
MIAQATVVHDLLRAGPRPALAGIGTALPPHRYEQRELFDALRGVWRQEHYNEERLERLHEAVEVGTRHLALPAEAYAALGGFAAANQAFVEVGTEIGARACRDAIDAAGLSPRDVDAIFFTTVTGVSTPSIDAHLVNALPLRPDVRRTPMFGLGCVGGAAGLARMSDYLRGYPDHVALLASVELCSLTLQRDDLSIPNLIATGLFGDGAAAVVGVGAHRTRVGNARAHARVIDQRSVFYPDTEWVMGWEVRDAGFKVVLSGRLPEIIEENLGADVDAFLAEHALERGHIDHWICHPGGPKVMAALERALDLPEDALDHARRTLRDMGNLSSASVLHVLAATAAEARSGDRGLLLAMGPGFCAEMLLLAW